MLNIIVGLIGLAVVILSILVFLTMRQIKHLFIILVSMSGLPVGQKAPKIENQSTKQLLSTKGQAVLIFSSLTCSACEQLIKEINEKQIYKKIPLYILVLNKQKEIQDFSEVNKLNFELYPISQTTREKFNIVMEPFCYYLEDQVIRSKGTINSSEELLNIHSTESIS